MTVLREHELVKKQSGEPSLQRILPEVADKMQKAIADADGNEVFFAGTLDSSGRVSEVRVCARGNEGAVTALFDSLQLREVVLHNHPGGNLTPSQADLELAAVYSANGHGVYIVDNDVTQVYVVVEPFLPRESQWLNVDMLWKVLANNGPMARQLPHYEEREQQHKMMEVVSNAFNRDGIAVIEAPTGVGKTLAYLLPAIEWAVNNRERVVISTRTINLQEQIITKDIPLLQQCLEHKFSACLVKGRSNYLCLRKLRRAQEEATLFDEEDHRTQLAFIQEWSNKTEDGSLSDLPLVPARDLWEKVCSEADSCSMGRCPDQKKCFVGRARREVARADIIVANHHILFSDVAIKQETGNFSALAVLPAYSRVIFDEAHSIEDSATEYFGVSATKLGAMATFGRLYRIERGIERGLLALIVHKLVKSCPKLSRDDYEPYERHIRDVLIPHLQMTRENILHAFDGLRSLAAMMCRQIGRDIKWRLTQDVLQYPELRDFHDTVIVPLAEEGSLAVKHCLHLAEMLKKIPVQEADAVYNPFVDEMPQLTALAGRLDRLTRALTESTSDTLKDNTVRWVEIDAQKEQFIRVARCPLEVGKPLSEWVYNNLKTVVMTSATLSVRQEFAYLFQRLGLDLCNQERIETAILDTPYDFRKQALLCLPKDIVEPSAPDFLNQSTDFILHILKITRGHAFVLFTSFHALDYTFKRLESELRRIGITPLRQGAMNRNLLLEKFREDISSVLFATDSFWEGVDVAGESLQCVILPKLPFRVPSEPILEARAEAIETAGGNAFMSYSVPQAVIKFRQGFGRLIRRRSDKGVVVVLDNRITSKYYGKIFLESLPPLKKASGTKAFVLNDLKSFFE